MIILNIFSTDLASSFVSKPKKFEIAIRKRSASYTIRETHINHLMLSLTNSYNYILRVGKNGSVDGVRSTYKKNANGEKEYRNSTLFHIYEIRALSAVEHENEHNPVLIRSRAGQFLYVCMNKTGHLHTRALPENRLPMDCVWDKNMHFFAHRFYPPKVKGRRRKPWYLEIDANANAVQGPYTNANSPGAWWSLIYRQESKFRVFVNIIINKTRHHVAPMRRECLHLKRVVAKEVARDIRFSQKVLRRLELIKGELERLFTVFHAKERRIQRFRRYFDKWVQLHWRLKQVHMKIALFNRRKKKFIVRKRMVNKYGREFYNGKIKATNDALKQSTNVLRQRKRQWNRVQWELTSMLESISMTRARKTGRTRLHDYIYSIVRIQVHPYRKICLAVYIDSLRRRFKNDMEALEALKFRQLRRRMSIIQKHNRNSVYRKDFRNHFSKRKYLEPSRPFSSKLIKDWGKFPKGSLDCAKVQAWKRRLSRKKGNHRKRKNRRKRIG